MIYEDFNKAKFFAIKLAIRASMLIFILLVGTIGSIQIYGSYLLQQNNQILVTSDKLAKKGVELNRNKTYLQTMYEANKFWNQITKNYGSTNGGLDFVKAVEIITALIESNGIYPSSTIVASNQENIAKFGALNNNYIVGSSLEFKLQGVSDSQFYSFLSGVEDNLPGFLKITSFNAEIKDGSLDQIITDLKKNTFDILVTSDIKAEWYDFKNN